MKNFGWWCFGLLFGGMILLGILFFYLSLLHFDP